MYSHIKYKENRGTIPTTQKPLKGIGVGNAPRSYTIYVRNFAKKF